MRNTPWLTLDYVKDDGKVVPGYTTQPEPPPDYANRYSIDLTPVYRAMGRAAMDAESHAPEWCPPLKVEDYLTWIVLHIRHELSQTWERGE